MTRKPETPENALTESEAKSLLEAAEDPMTGALVSTVWCLALRSHEAPEIEVQHVSAADSPVRKALYGDFEEAVDHYLQRHHPHLAPGSRLFPSLEPNHASVEVTLTIGELATRAEPVEEVTEERLIRGAESSMEKRGLDPAELHRSLELDR